MVYFKHIDNGEGPLKLFIGGVHGNEGKTSIKLIKLLKKQDFSQGQIYIYNFDKSPYISTVDKEFYTSKQGLKLLDLINFYKPDFYTELHCYNITNFHKLTDISRIKTQGVPPLIDCGEYVLVSSVSPLIRKKYFTPDTICKTLEIPCLDDKKVKIAEDYFNFSKDASINRYMDILKLITKSTSRLDFTKRISKDYPHQFDLAREYVKYIFGESFPPF